MQTSAFKNGNQSRFTPQRTAAVQPKLMVNAPGDRYEQEADAMAERVMRMPQHQPAVSSQPVSTGLIARSIQRKCAACEAEEEKKKNGGMLMRKAEGSGGFAASPDLVSQLNATKGGGLPLPEGTRSFMETAFSTDFSGVRVHTDERAAEMSQSIQAKAFTYGGDVYFNRGQYDPGSLAGKRLLAHELGHVVQQGVNSFDQIQKSNFNVFYSDEETLDNINGFDPVQIVIDYIEEIYDDYIEDIYYNHSVSSKLSDARYLREFIMLHAQLDKLSYDDVYFQKIVESYGTGSKGDEEFYLDMLKSYIASFAKSEILTMEFINNTIGVNVTQDNFIDHVFFQSFDAANAFPFFSIKIFLELIRPSDDLYSEVSNDLFFSSSKYVSKNNEISKDLFELGLPVDYWTSLSLYDYNLIKRNIRNIRKIYKFPNEEWIIEKIIKPEDFSLHSPKMSEYKDSFANLCISNFKLAVYNTWVEKYNLVALYRYHNYYLSTKDISRFRKEFPRGFSSLTEFYDNLIFMNHFRLFQLFVLSSSLSSGNPYVFFINSQDEIRTKAKEALVDTISQGSEKFIEARSSADSMVRNLNSFDKLNKAVNMSIDKGFAGESIEIFLDKLNEILEDILEDVLKEQAIRKTIAWLSLAAPVKAKAIAFAYSFFRLYEDIKDLVELTKLLSSLIKVIDTSMKADSIISTQRSSARLAEATVALFPKILTILGSRLTNKLTKQIVPDSKKSDAYRFKKLDDSRNVKTSDLVNKHPDLLVNETEVVLKSTMLARPDLVDIDVIIPLRNGHEWRRNKITKQWCRTSSECTTLSLNSDFVNELNKKANSYLPDEFKDLGPHSVVKYPPGWNKHRERTYLGTFVHSEVYTKFLNWIDTPEGADWLEDQDISRADLGLNIPEGTISREYTIQHPDFPTDRRPKADVVDWDNAKIHEIKPAGLERQGAVESAGYAEMMNLYHARGDGRKWTHGETLTYNSEKVYDLFFDFGFFESGGDR